MANDKIPAHIADRLAPGVADAMAHDQQLEAAAPADESLAERRMRQIREVLFWSRGLPTPEALELHVCSAAGRNIPVQIFRGRNPAPAPVLLYIHGGGWVGGSVAHNEAVIRTIVDQTGWTIAAPTYRLAPENPYPAGLDDCLAVANWLHHYGPELGLSTDCIAVSGASAGANLALATALRLRAEKTFNLSGLLLFYPITTPDLTSPSYEEFANGDFGLSRAAMETYFDQYDPDNRRHTDPHICPSHADLSGLPPTKLVAAELDVLCSDSLNLHAQMLQAGVKSECNTIKGVPHGFINRGKLVPAAAACLEDCAKFLNNLG